MEVKVPHNQGKEIAFSKAQKMMKQLEAEYGDKVQNLQEVWSGNSGKYSCTFNGLKLEGTIEVHDNDVVVKGSLPFFALPFKGVVEEAIRTNVEKALAK